MSFISPEMWYDRRFRSLTPIGKLVWVYLLTNRTAKAWAPGLYEFRLGTLGEDAGLAQPEAEQAFKEILDKGLAEYDPVAHFIRVPKAPYYNLPQNFNMLRGWYAKWKLVPRDSPLKAAHLLVVEAIVSNLISDAKRDREPDKARRWLICFNETFGRAKKLEDKVDRQGNLFDLNGMSGVSTSPSETVLKPLSEPLRNGYLNPQDQDQDQDQEKDQDQESGSGESAERGFKATAPDSVKASDPTQASSANPTSEPAAQVSPPAGKGRGRVKGLSEEKSAALSQFREVAERLWDFQDELRHQIPGLRRLKKDDVSLAAVACRLAEGSTEEEARHVLQVYCAESKLKPDSAQWFDGTTNWREENFRRTLGKPIPKLEGRSNTGHYQHTGDEEYPDGEVKI